MQMFMVPMRTLSRQRVLHANFHYDMGAESARSRDKGVIQAKLHTVGVGYTRAESNCRFTLKAYRFPRPVGRGFEQSIADRVGDYTALLGFGNCWIGGMAGI